MCMPLAGWGLRVPVCVMLRVPAVVWGSTSPSSETGGGVTKKQRNKVPSCVSCHACQEYCHRLSSLSSVFVLGILCSYPAVVTASCCTCHRCHGCHNDLASFVIICHDRQRRSATAKRRSKSRLKCPTCWWPSRPRCVCHMLSGVVIKACIGLSR
jgi:hypothetical protein